MNIKFQLDIFIIPRVIANLRVALKIYLMYCNSWLVGRISQHCTLMESSWSNDSLNGRKLLQSQKNSTLWTFFFLSLLNLLAHSCRIGMTPYLLMIHQKRKNISYSLGYKLPYSKIWTKYLNAIRPYDLIKEKCVLGCNIWLGWQISKNVVSVESFYSKDIRNLLHFQSRSKIVKNIQCQNFASQNCRPTRVDLAFGFLSIYNVIPV